MQSIGWASLAAAVILQMVAVRQHTVTYAGAEEVSESGFRRARAAGLGSAAAMAVASVAFYLGEALDGRFLIGVGVFIVAVIVSEAVRWVSQRRFERRQKAGSAD